MITGNDISPITDAEFKSFKKMIYDVAGINLSEAKKALVSGRLSKRVRTNKLDNFGDYFKLIQQKGHSEWQVAVDLLTTNETYFFREHKHFEFLKHYVLNEWSGGAMRIWSAASSSGEEAYSIAMLLAEYARSERWEIIGTDISTQMVKKASAGLYPMTATERVPESYLKKYCLKGIGSQKGVFLIDPDLRSRVKFHHANLQENLKEFGSFDIIFLRNVLIYFDLETKKQVVTQILKQLKPGGYFLVSHSESLNGISQSLKATAPSIYRYDP